jgi:hypothetical protein
VNLPEHSPEWKLEKARQARAYAHRLGANCNAWVDVEALATDLENEALNELG